MSKGSPFYIETQLGKLELTKGTYLTLQKRNHSTLRTLAKTKSIAKTQLYYNNKATVKRCLRSTNEDHCPLLHVTMRTRKGNHMIFPLLPENNPKKWRMLRSLPSIQMAYDNDDESQEGQIEGAVNNLAMSLSVAAFDNRFKV